MLHPAPSFPASDPSRDVTDPHLRRGGVLVERLHLTPGAGFDDTEVDAEDRVADGIVVGVDNRPVGSAPQVGGVHLVPASSGPLASSIHPRPNPRRHAVDGVG